MEMSASLSVAFSWTRKIFNFRERLGLGDFFCFFPALVIIQLADARLFWCEGKVKTGRLQSVIGHVATPPQGVGSAWGKDLAPPERPGVRARPSCARP